MPRRVSHYALIHVVVIILVVSLVVLSPAGRGQVVKSSLPAPQEKKVRFSCVANNVEEVHVDQKTGKEEEVENWVVDCRVTYGEEVVYNRVLPLGRPTSYLDAMAGIDEFRKGIPKLIKEWREEHAK